MLNKKICFVTAMAQMPNNCFECVCEHCRLPMNNKTNDGIKKAYMTKRHKDCPLVEIEIQQ